MDMIMMVSNVSANIAMLLLLVVLLKFVTKRLHMKKAERFLMKLHKSASYGLVISGLLHGVTSFKSFLELGIVPYALGGVCFLSIVGAIYTFHLRKTNRTWLNYHRVLALIAMVTLVLHPLL